MFNLTPASPEAYALIRENFTALGKANGRMGGTERVATVVKSIRAARPDSILLAGGDTWHGLMTSLLTKGQDLVNVMTSHWEWTYGTERVKEIVDGLPFRFLIPSGAKADSLGDSQSAKSLNLWS
jgi:sulfur-oxidizing protein SoxB